MEVWKQTSWKGLFLQLIKALDKEDYIEAGHIRSLILDIAELDGRLG